MVFRNLIFDAKVVEQRLGTGVLSHHNPQASVNGDEEEHRQNACSYRRCCQHFSSHSRRLFQQPPLFATSLTKSASSRVFNSFFIPFAHTPTVVQSRFFSGRCAAILGLFFPVQPTGSVRVTSSSRCCPPDISPITCDHDDVFELPDGSREAGSLFS